MTEGRTKQTLYAPLPFYGGGIKITVPCERSCNKEYTSGLKVMAKVKVFKKVGQTSRSRSQGKKLWYHVKGLVTRNTHAI